MPHHLSPPPLSLLRDVVDRMHDPVVVTHLGTGQIAYVNPAFERAFGVHPDQTRGRTTAHLDVYVDSSDRDEMRALLRVGTPIHRRLTRLRGPDGAPRFFLIDAEIIEHAGEPHSFSLVRDVDAEHRLRVQLDATERLLTAAGQASDLTIWDVDLLSERIRLHEAGTLKEMPLADRFGVMRPEDLANLQAIFERAVQGKAPNFEGVYRIPSPHGDRWMQTRGRLLRDPAGTPVRMVGLDLDVTEAQVTLAALRQTRGLLDHLLEAADVMVVGLDVHGRVRLFNAAAERITGYTSAEVLGSSWFDFIVPQSAHPEVAALFFASVGDSAHASATPESEPAAAPANFEHENHIHTRGGETRQIMWRNRWHQGADQAPLLVGFGIDVTDQRRAEREIKRLAYTDALTGLANRLRFMQALEAALNGTLEALSAAGSQPPAPAPAAAAAPDPTGGAWPRIGVVLIDLDHFHHLNDAFGHDLGDAVLAEVAGRLRGAQPAPDLLARLGGDEFVALCVSEDPGCLRAVAEALQQSLTQPLAVGPGQLAVSASMGIAGCRGELDAAELLRRADLALYRAKAQGRDRIEPYLAGLSTVARNRMQCIVDLDRALECDHAGPPGLWLAWQPQVNLETGRLVGVEALARWSHEGTFVSPGQFIPLAEQSGRILALGAWVLRQACRTAAAWRARGLAFNLIAVNVSALELQTPGYVASVAQVLRETGLPAEYLELELTESALAEDAGRLRQRLQALRALGVHLSLDDFGTGYSSLRALKGLPFNRLKIAQEFVFDITDAGADLAIVRATLALAESFGLEVVAEGIETRSQRECLLGLGCSVGQGYWFARPQSADEVARLMLRAQPLLPPEPSDPGSPAPSG